tara:strand:+ start:257 stop:985 length:729 start_codon:yes stop_codon:yes gene_type:complete
MGRQFDSASGHKLKKYIKKRKKLYKFLINFREVLRIFYNVKTRSRYLWNLRDGDNKASLNYPIKQNSIVFDIGAYRGSLSKKVFKKFQCQLYLFEPLTEEYEYLKKHFKDNREVKVFNFGLLDKDEELYFSNIFGASSIFERPKGNLSIKVKMKSFKSFVKENSIESIDLMYMNIEGSEYKLLNEIIDTGYIENINYLQIQFHSFVNDSIDLRRLIRKQLRKTHKCIFNYPFLWESWEKKIL